VLPDVHLVTRNQSLRGVVVDPQGKPVAGATVSCSLARTGDSLSRPPMGPVPWTKTDEEGRFELTMLPDEPIRLMVYIANPKGGVIRYASHADPKMNQQDIEILFDPDLSRDRVEDLDAKTP